jgi:pimeloyl-ACP methyl ester carboxylesterase
MHVLSFSPLAALKRVSCPVLGLWGQLDDSTDALIAERNMRAMLREAGNKDVTLKIFPNANHALLEMPSANRMAPGVFATLRSWLARHIQT